MSDPSPDDRARRISTLFLDAAELPPSDRAAFLDTVCQGDPALREEIVSLLKNMDETGGLIDDLADKGMEEALKSLVGDGFSLDGIMKELSDDTEKTPDPLVGQTVSHFKIVERIGAGGMGVVYKARDTRLERDVALKFLPPYIAADEEAKRRFINEARAASAIDHPNIGAVYEVGDAADGRSFIAMAHYKGRTLKELLENGPLPVEKALRIVKQVAEGLRAAHGKGLVHRDIKPANVMLSENGAVKILDFGIAKLSGAETMTRAGSTAGTAAYMSPEQTRGETMDTRTDIWSLGVMLYELLSGKRPFRGDNIAATIHAIQQSEPASIESLCPDVDPAASHLISGCLVKQADKRYQGMAEFLSDLELIKASNGTSNTVAQKTNARKRKPRVAIAIAACFAIGLGLVAWFAYYQSESNLDPIGEKSIAILPLENLSPNPDNAYFADGIHDEILTNLANISDLLVIGRTSVRQYRDTIKTLQQIGKELGVRYLVEGSVFRDQNQASINIQLIDTASRGHIWAEKYDRNLDNLFSIRSAVAKDVAEQLHAVLSQEEAAQLEAFPTEIREAYDVFLRGKQSSGWERIRLYQQAASLDPDYLDAWYLLGFQVYHWKHGPPGIRHNPELLEIARQGLTEVKRLAPDSQYHLNLKTTFAVNYDYNLEEALNYRLERVARFGGHQGLGLNFLQLGKLSEARKALEVTVRVDPLQGRVRRQLFSVYVQLGLWDEARAVIEDYLTLREIPKIENTIDQRQLLQLEFLRSGGQKTLLQSFEAVPQFIDSPRGQLWKAVLLRGYSQAQSLMDESSSGVDLALLFSADEDRGLDFEPYNLVSALIHHQQGEEKQQLEDSLKAKKYWEKALSEHHIADPDYLAQLAICYALEGNRENLETMVPKIRELTKTVNWQFRRQAECEVKLAIAYLVLGENDTALELLGKAGELHSPMFLNRELEIWFIFDRLRGDPRFNALLDG